MTQEQEKMSKERSGTFEAGRGYEKEFQERLSEEKKRKYLERMKQQEEKEKEISRSGRRKFAKSIGLNEETEIAYVNGGIRGFTEEQMLEYIEKLPEPHFLSNITDKFVFGANDALLSEETVLKIFKKLEYEGKILRVGGDYKRIEIMAKNVNEKIRDSGFLCGISNDLTDGLGGSTYIYFKKVRK